MAHIVVIGAGGVGTYFAALLAEHQHTVTVVARGDTLSAITEFGLRVAEPEREPRVVTDVHAVADLDDIPEADLVLVCVKSWQVADAATLAQPVVTPRTLVVPVQNGIDAGDRLAAALHTPTVVGGVCTVFTQRTEAAGSTRLGAAPTLMIGSLLDTASESEQLQWAATLLTHAGIRTRVSGSIRRDLWKKLMFVASFGGVAALAGASAGVVRSHPRTRALFHTALQEVAAVARASGTDLTDHDVARGLTQLDTTAPDSTPSMMRDLAAGQPSELYDQTGAMVHRGEQLGIPTPTHTVIYGALLPRELESEPI